MNRVLFFAILLSIGFGAAASIQSLAASDELKVGGRTLDGWVKDLDSENEVVRLRAVKSLGPFGKAAIPALVKALSDKSDGVQYWAADHLGSVGSGVKKSQESEKTVSRLEMLAKKQKAISIAAAYALFQINNKQENLAILVKGLGHSERGMACSSAEFLGKIGPAAKSTLPALEKQFKQHKDYHVRGACKNAIRKIKNEPVR